MKKSNYKNFDVSFSIMILFNLFQLNWQSPLEGKSLIALIGIIASLCALLLLIILEISKKNSNYFKG